MARYEVLTTFKVNEQHGMLTAQVGQVEYTKGQVVELTPAQVTALGSSNFRALSSVSGTASPTHDLAGEGAGASN